MFSKPLTPVEELKTNKSGFYSEPGGSSLFWTELQILEEA